jgi:hypothetical protein
MSRRSKFKAKNYYTKVFRKRWRSISLILTSIVTVPLFVYTALPPVEIVDEVPEEIVNESFVEQVQQVEKNETIQVPVNKTISVPVNITQQVELNRTIDVNVTEGSSIFLGQQAAPQLIDSDIVLVVDTSGSMGGVRMETAKQSITNLLSAINQSASLNLTNDRVSLVTFSALAGDNNWVNDAVVETGLEFVTNQTHLNDVSSITDSLTAGGGTDIWAGLNVSLQLLLDNKRTSPSIQSIILLTDGVHQTGPWDDDVELNGNYTGFMQVPSNFSGSVDSDPYSESPVKVARENGVKIYTIGIFDENTFDFDQNFLMNISLDANHGTFGDFFAGNDSLSVTESFLQARDGASGWIQLVRNDTTVILNDTIEVFSYNVTENIRRVKFDLNWNNSIVDFNVTIINPQNETFGLSELIPQNFNLLLNQQPKSVIIDFPILGIWKFNVTAINNSDVEEVKSRLASFESPVFLDSVTQLNVTTSDIVNNVTIGSNSIVFGLDILNKNPIFSYTNITASLLLNSSLVNYTAFWTPMMYSQLGVNETKTFELNITLHEPVLLEGELIFLINSSEGYFDTYSQPILLDYRINKEDVVVETYFEDQTIMVLEEQTIVVLEDVIVNTLQDVTETITEFKTDTGYTYNRTVFNIFKWIGLVSSFMVLSAIFILYIKSQEIKLRDLSLKFGRSLFRDRSAVSAALARAGVDVDQISLDDDLIEVSSFEEFEERVYLQTGTQLNPESLIESASGLSLEQVADRLSYFIGLPPADVLSQIRSSNSIDHVIDGLGLSFTEFLDIIAVDEEIEAFQSSIRELIAPSYSPTSDIEINELVDIDNFQSSLRSL